MNVKQLLGAISATIIKVLVAAAIIIVVFRLAVYAYNFGYQVFTILKYCDIITHINFQKRNLYEKTFRICRCLARSRLRRIAFGLRRLRKLRRYE